MVHTTVYKPVVDDMNHTMAPPTYHVFCTMGYILIGWRMGKPM